MKNILALGCAFLLMLNPNDFKSAPKEEEQNPSRKITTINVQRAANTTKLQQNHYLISGNELKTVNSDTNYETTPSIKSGNTYVRGKIRWQDDNDNFQNARNVLVELYDDDGDLLGNGLTDDHGNYAIGFSNKDKWYQFENGGYDLYVQAYAGDSKLAESSDDTVTVYNGLNNLYITQKPTKYVMNVKTNSLTYIDIDVNKDNEIMQGIQIGQALLTARNFSRAMMSNERPKHVKAKYCTDESVKSETSYFNPLNFQINLFGEATYKSWDTIMHEYGHSIEHCVNNIGEASGEHDLNDNLLEKYGFEKASELAWKEAWATVFGMVAQDYYSDYLINIETTCDSRIDNYKETIGKTGMDFRVMWEGEPFDYGETNELSIIKILWNMYKGSKGNLTNLTAKKWWNLTTTSGIRTLADFAYNLFNDKSGNSYKKTLGDFFSTQFLSCSNVELNGFDNINSSPSVTVQADKNAYIGIEIYSDALVNVYTISERLIFHGVVNTFEIDNNDWKKILEKVGDNFYVTARCTIVRLSNNHYESSGTYYSKFISCPNPIKQRDESFYASERYAEFVDYLEPAQKVEYNLTVDYDGIYLIQTFGTIAVQLECYDFNCNLISSNRGYSLFGNSLLSLEFKANKVYKIRVFFTSSNSEGYVKTSVIKIKNKISRIFDIDLLECTNENGGNPNTIYMDKSVSTISAFIPSESREYRFETESPLDSFIYVIDVRSTECLVAGSDYDDDSGSNYRQSRIDTKLEAGIPYLIITCTYNPTTIYGNKVYLYIRKI